MDQHPVPQNISSYEFRLVGDMTLKQFFQLSGGVVAALVFYRSPFPFFIKWPLIFVSVLGGILLAFVPLQGRPFSQWILAFFKAVYSPTQYLWNPAPVTSTPSVSPPNLGGDQSEGIKKASSPLDKLESQLVDKMTDLFASVIPRPGHRPAPTPPPLAKPDPALQGTSHLTVDQLRAIAAGTIPPPPPAPPPLDRAAMLTPIISYAPKPSVAPALAASAAVLTPTRPNILAGIVTQGGEIPIEGVILEIAEKASGLPVRALRSNKLGQFQIATPLAPGEYVITAEKEGYVFEPLLIRAQGQIIAPIDIRGKVVS